MAELTIKQAATIGKQLAKLCLIMGMYKNELAVKLGYTNAHINSVMKGKTIPSIELFYRLIKRYPNISVTWLLFDEGDPFVDNKVPKILSRYNTHQMRTLHENKRVELAKEVIQIAGKNFIKKYKISVPESVLKSTQKKK